MSTHMYTQRNGSRNSPVSDWLVGVNIELCQGNCKIGKEYGLIAENHLDSLSKTCLEKYGESLLTKCELFNLERGGRSENSATALHRLFI